MMSQVTPLTIVIRLTSTMHLPSPLKWGGEVFP